MNRETKFLHLKTPAMLGERINGWRVCWLGGWDRGKLFYSVMVEKTLQSIYTLSGLLPDETSRSAQNLRIRIACAARTKPCPPLAAARNSAPATKSMKSIRPARLSFEIAD
jgi:hypothetical protein